MRGAKRALALAGLAFAAAAVFAFAWPGPDEAAAQWLGRAISPDAQDAWRAATWPGDTAVGLGVAIAGALACLLARQPTAALVTAATPALSALAVHALKVLGGRERPPGGADLASYAFPSGHAAMSTVAWGVLALVALPALAQRWPRLGRLRLAAAGLALGIAAATGVGRLLAGVHWPTDVVAGWAWGGMVLAATRLAAGLKPPRRGGAMRVLGFTGMPGSGKSEAMEVAKARGHPVVRMGDLIWEEVERQGLPRDAANVGKVANAMREAHGKDIWGIRTAERVRKVAAGHPLVLIDGIRNIEEVHVLRRELGHDFVLVAIHTDPDHRFDRMVKRGRADDSKDVDVLKARDEREMNWGIARTIALADEMLVNDTTLEAFRAKVGKLLDRLAH